MKKFLILGFIIAAGGAASAHAQTRSFTAPATPDRKPRTERQAPTPSVRPAVGALPRAGRGNPIQMINPAAPRKYYGPPDETVTYDPYNPSRVTGIILFGIRW